MAGPDSPKAFIPKFKHMPANTRYVTLPNGWAVAIINIGPDLALEMLSRMPERQRKQKENAIKRYSSDMEVGDWRLTHQGIAFDEKGELVDGQNRLKACVVSESGFNTLVFFGVGQDAGSQEMQVIDTSVSRTLRDSAKIAGLDANAAAISTVGTMVRYGVTNGQHIMSMASRLRRLAIVEKFQKAAEEVCSWFVGGPYAKKISVATVTAAVTCASYYHEAEKLKRFVTILLENDEPGPGENAPKVLKQFILSKTNSGGSDETRREIFLKTCKALQLFLKGKNLDGSLYAAKANPFPIEDKLNEVLGEKEVVADPSDSDIERDDKVL